MRSPEEAYFHYGSGDSLGMGRWCRGYLQSHTRGGQGGPGTAPNALQSIPAGKLRRLRSECKALCKAPDLSAARNASLALATIPQGSAGPAVSTRLSTCDREKRCKDIMAKYPSHIITGAILPSMGFCKRFTFRALASIGNGLRGSAS